MNLYKINLSFIHFDWVNFKIMSTGSAHPESYWNTANDHLLNTYLIY